MTSSTENQRVDDIDLHAKRNDKDQDGIQQILIAEKGEVEKNKLKQDDDDELSRFRYLNPIDIISHRSNEKNEMQYQNNNLATGYCGAFSADVIHCVCPLLRKDIRVVYVAANYNQNENAVTFITAAWADDFYSGALDDTLNAWSAGQKVSFVVGFAESTQY